MRDVTRVVIMGGGPGGYEAALVAAQLGAAVTVVDRDGIGGSAVLTDCVPSKTLHRRRRGAHDGRGERRPRRPDRRGPAFRRGLGVDLAAVNARVKRLAAAQSDDIGGRLQRDGVEIRRGIGRLDGPGRVVVDGPDAGAFDADVVLVATGARPRVLPAARPDGERILTWEQVYDLPVLPERLIVVGSGVTGAEFACAYDALGSDVVLVSSATGSFRERTRTPRTCSSRCSPDAACR